MIHISTYPRAIAFTGNEIILAMTTDLAGALLEIRIDNQLGERLSTVTVTPDSAGNAVIDISNILQSFIEPIGYNSFGQYHYIRLCGNVLQYSITIIEKKDAAPGTKYFEWANGPVVKALRGALSLQEMERKRTIDPFMLYHTILNSYLFMDIPVLEDTAVRIYFLSEYNASINLYVYRYMASGDRYGTIYLTGGWNMKIYDGCIYEVTVPYELVKGFDFWYLTASFSSGGTLFQSGTYKIEPSSRYRETLLIRNRYGTWDQVQMILKAEDTDTKTAPVRIGTRAEAETSAMETVSLVSRYYTSAETLCELATASEMYLLRNGCAVPFVPKSLALPISNAGKRMNAVLQGYADTDYRTVLRPLPPYEQNLAAYIVDCDGNTGEGYAFGRNTNDILQNSIKRITATVAGGYIEFSPNNVFSINNLNLDYFRSIIGFDHARPYRFPLHYFTAQMYMRSFVGARSIVAGNSDNNPFPILYYFNDYTDSPYVEQYMETFGNSPIESDFPLWARWSSFADNKLVDLKGNASLDMMMTPFVQLADSLGNSISVPCNCSINPADSFSIELAIHGDWGYMSLFYLHGTDYDIELRSEYGFFVLSKIPKIGNKTSVNIADGGASLSMYWKHLHLYYNQNTGVVTMTVIGTDLPWNQTYTVTFPAMMLPAGLETFSLITFNAGVIVSRNKYIDISFMRIMSLANLKAVVLFSGMQAYEIMSKGYATATGTDSGNNFRANCQHIWGQCGYEIWDNDVDTLLVPLANDGASMSEGRYIPATNGRSIVNCILSNSDIIDIRSGFEFRSKSEALMARDTQFIFFEPGGMQRAISASDLRNAFLQDVWYLRARTTQYTVSYMRMKDEG